MSADQVESKIYQALYDHLELYALNTDPVTVVQYPGADFKTPTGKYLRANVLPAETVSVEVGAASQNRHSGIFQVDVLFDQGTYSIDATNVVGQIVAHFKRGTRLDVSGVGVLKVVRPPSYSGPVGENSHQVYVVSVRYQVDADNPS